MTNGGKPSGERTIHIYQPSNLTTLLQQYRTMPKATVFAGGSYLLMNEQEKYLSFTRDIITVDGIDELKRISRTERYLEIGSAVTLNRLLEIGKHIMPKALFLAIRQIASYQIRNRATLGGNLCVPDQRMDCYPVLLLMDVRVEVRSAAGSKWINLNQLVDSNNALILSSGEIVTRIRIPTEQPDVQVYRKIGSRSLSPYTSLSFTGLAKIQKGSLNGFRFCFGGMKDVIVRNKHIEAELTGRKLPLSEKDISAVMEDFTKGLDAGEGLVTAFQRDRMTALLAWFIDLISGEY
ncbi:MAG: FAD binding domain-containing protein [Spirochaetia bacterium]